MEDMARLAMVEQSVRDVDKYSKILYELLRHINIILENPHDNELRTIKSKILKEFLKLEALCDYLKYLGFETENDSFTYPSKLTLSNLRMAQAAIERKINLCYGGLDKNQVIVTNKQGRSTKTELKPVFVLPRNNEFLLKIQDLFNNMLVYEDPKLQEEAREHIPIVTLQLMALDRVREQQARIKKGETNDLDLPFDIALLMELMEWFKYKFFKWIDKPQCEQCGAETVPNGITSLTTDTETCRVEVYKCTICDGGGIFPRYNDARRLLTSRGGRCGEWANCFTLLCRSLGYDTRYVYDVTDHVWCEVYDYDSNTWLHVDPCENKLDSPLMYEHGWNKKLSYVIAVSRDDVQDVTWRYTMNHKLVLSRRRLCTEQTLISTLLKLREARQASVSVARRQYLARRTLKEIVQLMIERKPSEYERQGRESGSRKWREERGEAGGTNLSHTFTLTQPGEYRIKYFPSRDVYTVERDGELVEQIKGWQHGTYQASSIFKKVEHDWKMVYLAREEGSASGSVSWRVCCTGASETGELRVSLAHALYCGAAITYTLAFDDEEPQTYTLSDRETVVERSFRSVIISATLKGGDGALAWQHAQLFRDTVNSNIAALQIVLKQ